MRLFYGGGSVRLGYARRAAEMVICTDSYVKSNHVEGLDIIFMLRLVPERKSKNESHTALLALEALNKESSFAAWQQRPKGFKGTCNFCGKCGHKGVDCFKRKNNEGEAKPAAETQSKFGGKCWICGKPGHRKSECRRNLNDRIKDNMRRLWHRR